MASTYLQLKSQVANRSGRIDGGTANTIRDNAINDVIRFTIADSHPFSWLKATATVVLVAGVADMPTNYNPTHKLQPGFVRIARASTNDDIPLTETTVDMFDRYAAGDYRYYIRWSSYRFEIVSTEQSNTLTVTYYIIPTALSADGDTSIIPDSECVTLLASAKVWLAKERDETNHDRDNALGLQRLGQMIINDKRANPLRPIRSNLYNVNLGYNIPG
ncbi:MAG: hypothetical protein H0U60_20110 [Blastocatellia bacterium]|nr:hypothetical protein [Blastocatellia bacterium]